MSLLLFHPEGQILTPRLQISWNDIMWFMSAGYLTATNIWNHKYCFHLSPRDGQLKWCSDFRECSDNQRKPWSSRGPDPSVWSETRAVTARDWGWSSSGTLRCQGWHWRRERSLWRKSRRPNKTNTPVKSESTEGERERGQGCKRTKHFIWVQEGERGWEWGRAEKREGVRETVQEACRGSLKKIAPSSLRYYITPVDKKNPTSSKVITAQ